MRVRYVPTAQFTGDAAESIVARVRARLGPVEVELEPTETIPTYSAPGGGDD